MTTNSDSLNQIPTMDNSIEHETEYRSISLQIDDFTSISQCRETFSKLKRLYDNMSAAKITEETFDLTKNILIQGNPEYNENPPRSKDPPSQAHSSSDTESYMTEDVISRIQTMQVDDQQADQSNKKSYIPPIIFDNG
ncbi:hypothetical protein CDAR_622461 [Caerostris darwini]|uniref:J domain-containing protein n=1 Tax=Caerostris darwini TaxID=1538125 RepID=A0AAV4N8U1_9ARAC|nr:hypothetical protein CDAR_622461 [Caerostris darwini]